MTVHTKSHQKGISFIGLVFVVAIIAMAGVVLAQVVPTVVEFMAVQKAAQKSAAGGTVAEVRAAFDKFAAVHDIKSISGKDIAVSTEGAQIVVSFSYQREIHLAGPAFLTLKYAGRSK